MPTLLVVKNCSECNSSRQVHCNGRNEWWCEYDGSREVLDNFPEIPPYCPMAKDVELYLNAMIDERIKQSEESSS